MLPIRPSRMHCLALASLVWSCAPSPMRLTAADVVNRVDADPIATYQQLHNTQVIVTGKVESKRLVPRHATLVSVESMGYLSRTSVASRQDLVAMVLFEPGSRVVCYFEPSELNAAAQVAVGSTATVECTLTMIREYQGRYYAELAYCKLQDTGPGAVSSAQPSQ